MKPVLHLSALLLSVAAVAPIFAAEFSYGKDSWPMGGSADFEITVPCTTALEIQNGWGGAVKIEQVTGDVEVKGLNCEVQLTDLSGGAVVETMNGEISASFAALPEKKPVSFSSMNGDITLRKQP